MVVVLKERNADSITILECAGRLNAGEEMAALSTRVQADLKEGKTLLILDLSQVNSIDSQDISALVRSSVSAGRHGGKLKLLKLSPRVRQVLDAARLFSLFEVFNDEAAAIASFE